MRLPRILSVISFRHSKGASLFLLPSASEDQTLTDIIVKIDKSARASSHSILVASFPETYQLIDKTNMTYGINLEVFFPNYEAVQQMVKEEGINLFYNSIESRHRCCQVRKAGTAEAGDAGTGCMDLRIEKAAERNPQGYAGSGMGRHS